MRVDKGWEVRVDEGGEVRGVQGKGGEGSTREGR